MIRMHQLNTTTNYNLNQQFSDARSSCVLVWKHAEQRLKITPPKQQMGGNFQSDLSKSQRAIRYLVG